MSGSRTYLKLGDWNAVCYQCGFKRKASELIRHWQGYYVCPEHWEPRQPQDYVRGTEDIQTPPWTQPLPQPAFSYSNKFLGISDGVQRSWQLGDGLAPTTVTQVMVGSSIVTNYTVNSFGLITFNTAPPVGSLLYASGSEIMA